MKRLFAILSIALALALTASAQVDPNPSNIVKLNDEVLSDSDSARLVIFEELWKFWNRGDRKEWELYYLDVDQNRDPSLPLLMRLNKLGMKIKLGSASVLNEEGGTVTDKISGKRGVLFTISKLEWNGLDEVKAHAGSQIGNMGADGCTFLVRRENGKWKTVSTEKCWIS